MPKQMIFKHSVPVGITQLTDKEIMRFDTVLADLMIKQEYEENKEKPILGMLKDIKK